MNQIRPRLKSPIVRNKLGHLLRATTILGILDVLIAFFLAWLTCTSVQVQDKLTNLQAELNRYSIEPELEGQFYHTADEIDPKRPDLFQLRNIGGDSAFGVWYKARWLVMNDTLIAYDQYVPEAFSIAVDKGRIFGDYSSDTNRAISPGGYTEFHCSISHKTDALIAEKLGGTLMLEVQYVYWDKLPHRQFWEKEYFIVNFSSNMFYEHTRLDHLDNGRYMKLKLDSLLASNNIGIIRPFDCDAETGSITHRLIMGQMRMTPYYSTIWQYSDTVVLVDKQIVSIGQFRKMYPDCAALP